MNRFETIARLYDAAPLTPSPRARRAYRLLAAYVDSRYFGTMPRDGWRAEAVYTDALPDIEAARRARVIPVLDLYHGHPCLGDAENYRFRAVHDLYGHGWIGETPLGFGVANERSAAILQLADFSLWGGRESWDILPTPPRGFGYVWLDARRALAGEIFGQAAYFEARGTFPAQKAFLLPLHFLGA